MPKFSVLLLAFCLLGSATAQDISSPDSEPSLGDVARQTKDRVKQLDAAIAGARVVVHKRFELISSDDANDRVRELLREHKFNELEAIAAQARSSRRQLAGGIWQLRDFYDTLASPEGGENAGVMEWNQVRDNLSAWISEMPGSYTAMIALATENMNFGWKIRGHGYGDDVSDARWNELDNQLKSAFTLISDPVVLNSDCPYRYDALMQIGLLSGFGKPQMQQIFQKAIAAEPDYYHYYRLYANYLQTKWYGAPGEVVAFAGRSADQIGGPKGDFVYFEIASLLGCECGDPSELPHFDWPRVKSGYAAMERMFGTSLLKQNRMASMAVTMKDFETARSLFREIGNNWDRGVWRSEQRFRKAQALVSATQNDNTKDATGR